MAERMFGVETEYAVSAVDAHGQVVDRLPVLRRMLDLLRQRSPTLVDPTGRGVFLPNGARCYIDYPDHPEFATPEVANPWDAVRYQRAGDRLLAELAAAAAPPGGAVFTLRCNVDYSGTDSTWGQHESYLHTCDPDVLPAQMIPHLVSRISYTGAAGFDSLRPHGAHFTLSPRAWHLHHAASCESQFDRGIFHTKQESLSRAGYHRLHVLAGESLASDTAAWLKVATTALVVALIDGGVRPGDGVQLRQPVAAMRTFASDSACRATANTTDGRLVRALDIQRQYLVCAEQHVGAPFMPPWADEACRRWRVILDLLEGAPDAVATTLDWAIKLALFVRHASRRGVAWASVPHWNEVAQTLDDAVRRSDCPDKRPLVDVLLGRRSPVAGTVPAVTPQLAARGLTWDGLKSFGALRQELFELDARFAQLGGGGVFSALERAGVLTHAVPGVDNIEHAMAHPPATGRARVRAAYVRELGRADTGRVSCDWSGVWDWRRQRTVDLRDPFTSAGAWGRWIPTHVAWGARRDALDLTQERPVEPDVPRVEDTDTLPLPF